MKQPIPLLHGQLVASAVMEHLRHHCVKIHVAGSVRRECSQVGDVEIVCLPHRDEEGHSEAFCNAVQELGVIAPVKTVARPIPARRSLRMSLPWANDIQLELHMPQASDYGRILAIRTGSREYAARFAKQWTNLGWCGTSEGLRRREQCEKKGELWKCIADEPALPPFFETENQFFDFLHIPILSPKARS